MTEEELAALVLRVRDLIVDPSGADFDDARVERALEANNNDPRHAAVELLVARLGILRAEFAVTVGSMKAERQQQIDNVRAHLAELRSSGGIRTMPAVRTDLR